MYREWPKYFLYHWPAATGPPLIRWDMFEVVMAGGVQLDQCVGRGHRHRRRRNCPAVADQVADVGDGRLELRPDSICFL